MRTAATGGMMVAVGALGALLAGCQPKPILPDSFLPPPLEHVAPPPSYAELVERYNHNIAELDQLWAKTSVKLRWLDEKDRTKTEQGDGVFMFITPSRVALTVGKDVPGVGTILWAGANEDRYWLFDLQDDHRVFVGRHAYVGAPCAQPLPLPVYPSMVPYLFGLMPLEPNPAGEPPNVEVLEGRYLIEPPGLNLRMLLDPATALPVRVDLTDSAGYTVVICALADHQPITRHDLPRERWSIVAAEADLSVVGEVALMTLKMRDRSDGRVGNKIKDRAFDYDYLLDRHHPEEVIDLDADCDEQ
jgi:hypothetical protein